MGRMGHILWGVWVLVGVGLARAQWSVEVDVTNASAGNARVAVAVAAGYVHVLMRNEGDGQVLQYFRGSNAWDRVVFEPRALGNPHQPNNGDKAFAMAVGTDERVRIVISGPGGAPENDYVVLGTETAVGSGVFAWETLVTNNRWANQIGFALDRDNKVYVGLKYQPTSQCSILDNVNGTWRETRFSTIDGSYPRLMMAVDPNNDAWVVFNGRHGGRNYIEVWSNRGGAWGFEMYLTNAVAGDYAGCYFLQSAAGFVFDGAGMAYIVMKPDWWSRELEVWRFGPIPEARWGWVVIAIAAGVARRVGRRKPPRSLARTGKRGGT